MCIRTRFSVGQDREQLQLAFVPFVDRAVGTSRVGGEGPRALQEDAAAVSRAGDNSVSAIRQSFVGAGQGVEAVLIGGFRVIARGKMPLLGPEYPCVPE